MTHSLEKNSHSNSIQTCTRGSEDLFPSSKFIRQLIPPNSKESYKRMMNSIFKPINIGFETNHRNTRQIFSIFFDKKKTISTHRLSLFSVLFTFLNDLFRIEVGDKNNMPGRKAFRIVICIQ